MEQQHRRELRFCESHASQQNKRASQGHAHMSLIVQETGSHRELQHKRHTKPDRQALHRAQAASASAMHGATATATATTAATSQNLLAESYARFEIQHQAPNHRPCLLHNTLPTDVPFHFPLLMLAASLDPGQRPGQGVFYKRH